MKIIKNTASLERLLRSYDQKTNWLDVTQNDLTSGGFIPFATASGSTIRIKERNFAVANMLLVANNIDSIKSTENKLLDATEQTQLFKMINHRLIIGIDNNTGTIDDVFQKIENTLLNNKTLKENMKMQNRPVITFYNMYANATSKIKRTHQAVTKLLRTPEFVENFTAVQIEDINTRLFKTSVGSDEHYFNYILVNNDRKEIIVLTNNMKQMAPYKIPCLIPMLLDCNWSPLQKEYYKELFYKRDIELLDFNSHPPGVEAGRSLNFLSSFKCLLDEDLDTNYIIEKEKEQLKAFQNHMNGRIKQSVLNFREEIRNYTDAIKGLYKRIRDAELKILSGENKLMEDLKDLIELLIKSEEIAHFEFHLDSNHLELYIMVKTTMCNFESDIAEMLYKRGQHKRSLCTEIAQNPRYVKAFEDLYTDVFLTNEKQLEVVQPIVLDLTDKDIRTATGSDSFGAFIRTCDENGIVGMRNPHLSEYQCFGSTRNQVIEALNENMYDAAVLLAINSVQNMNFADDTVFRHLTNGYMTNMQKDSHRIILEDGTKIKLSDYYTNHIKGDD